MKFELTLEKSRISVVRRLVALACVLVLAGVGLAGVCQLVWAQPIVLPAASSVVAPPESRSQAVSAGQVFFDDFEGPNTLNNWELTGHPGGPRWNLATSSEWVTYHSPSKVMWFANPLSGTYGTAGDDPIYSGTLTYKGTISLPVAGTHALLAFWSYEWTEMSKTLADFADICYGQVTCAFDVRQVWISGTLFPTYTRWQLLWSTDINPTVEKVWHPISLDISQYRGQYVRVRFGFNTMDTRSNDARGWYVDDVRLLTAELNQRLYLPLIHKSS